MICYKQQLRVGEFSISRPVYSYHERNVLVLACVLEPDQALTVLDHEFDQAGFYTRTKDDRGEFMNIRSVVIETLLIKVDYCIAGSINGSDKLRWTAESKD